MAGADSSELTWTPAWKLREMMQRKQVSPVEVMRDLLDRVDRYATEIGAFITVFPEDAIAGAKAAEKVIMRGDTLPLLHGLPVSVKDYVWTKGQRTTLGSRLFTDFVPDVDSAPSARLKAAGAIIFAKTNMPEFSGNVRTFNHITREALNPWNKKHTSGGSSGGSGVAVAAGLGALSVGSDDGGSIRLPSAFNGIFGLLPSRGRVANGVGFYSAPFCGIGPMTRDVRDAAMLLQTIAGHDPRDLFAAKMDVPDYLVDLEKGVKGVRMGWSPNWGYIQPKYPEVVDMCHRAATLFRDLGAVYDEPDFRFEDPNDALGLDAEYSPAQNLASFRAVDPAFKDKYMWMAELPPEKYQKLAIYTRDLRVHPTHLDYTMSILPEVRNKPKTRVMDMFKKYDLLISPTIDRTAFVSGGEPVAPWHYVAYTYIVNASGCCAASVPVGFHNGLPVGMQIVGRPNEEALVLRAARAFEQARPWAQHRPTL